MTNKEKLLKDLKRTGYGYRLVTIYNVNGSGKDCDGIMIEHNYNGLYPNENAIGKALTIRGIATKHGFRSDTRGRMTASIIYLN